MDYRTYCKENLNYEVQTSFWDDFTIAEMYGTQAIQDTFDISFETWKNNRVCGTELCMVLNHKIWQLYETNDTYARLYDRLWRKIDGYIMDHWKGDDLKYFLRTTD